MKGLISISENTLGRYTEFQKCLAEIQLDQPYYINVQIGVDIAFNFNKSILAMLQREFDWIWMLGDDHVFPPTLLQNLLGRNIDIVVPLYLHRTKPLQPVLQKEIGPGKLKRLSFKDLPKRTKLWRLPVGTYTGNAGMLVRRSVFEKIEFPWMEQGRIVPGRGGFDLMFCKKAQEKKIPVMVDLENTIGHMTHVGIWPELTNNGWSCKFEVE